MFHSFEHFVIMNTDEELNMSGQNDAPHNFDKISFLSEQVYRLIESVTWIRISLMRIQVLDRPREKMDLENINLIKNLQK